VPSEYRPPRETLPSGPSYRPLQGKEIPNMNLLNKMKWADRPAISVILRYGLALVSVAAAFGLTCALLHFHLPQTFGTFAVSAIAITFWYVGTGPGLLAMVLSSSLRGYFFEATPESRLLWVIVFFVFALLMMRVGAARHELERRVAERTAELTRSNDNLKREIVEHNQAEYLTRQVFECSPDAVLIIGIDYRYKRINPVHERNWGMPAGSMIGMHVIDLLGVEFFENKLRPVLDRCFTGESVTFEEWFDNALGHRFLSVSYSPLRSDSQQVEAALVITRDLTEHTLASEALRHTQADLAHASRMTTMGELTASLAHEVNQPIAAASTSASTCVRWLTRDDPDLEEAREAALAVVRNAKRAADIINRIRSISKKGESHRQLIDVNEVILEIIALLRTEAQRHSISIRTDLGANLSRVMADSVQVQQVMMNLIMNSIDAMKDVDRAREISVKSRSGQDGQLIVSVSDTGTGLPPQTADQIFDAFFTTKAHGIGMGLRISRSIVESHGGRLWAVDNSPHGTTFSFTLPTSDPSS
jgi:PAS domain S-box-containing protein